MMMMTIDRIKHKIVFKVRPSFIHTYVKIEKSIVPQEKPIILIGQRLPSKASNPYLVATITK